MRNMILLKVVFLSVGGCNEISNPQIKTQLYFGMSNAIGEVPEADWQDFREQVMENIFVGFTETSGSGYWVSQTGKKYYEKSIIITYTHQESQAEDQKIDSLIALFKSRFDQESVLQTDEELSVLFK